jgi:hypothetical protein
MTAVNGKMEKHQTTAEALIEGTTSVEPLGDDLLWGVVEIAEEIRRTPRQVLHLLERNLLPAKKVGRHWCSTRTALRKQLTT